jgi:thymidylate synthase
MIKNIHTGEEFPVNYSPLEIPKLNDTDAEYHNLLIKILKEGLWKQNRTGVKTLSIFGPQVEFKSVGEKFPLLTTKKIHLKSVIGELLWFLEGSTDKNRLRDHYGTTIWEEWKRPYTLSREVINIAPRKKDYEDFTNKISVDGLNITDEIDKKLLKIWLGMMKRCYIKDSSNSKFYKNISVSKDWQNPLTFISEVKLLPHWQYKKEDWDNFNLDKDYYFSNQYSKDTCVWLRKDENHMYTKNSKTIRVTFPDQKEKIYFSSGEIVRELDISSSSLSRILSGYFTDTPKGKMKEFSDFKFEELENSYLRLKLIDDGEMGPIYGNQWVNWNGEEINQIKNIIDKLKTDPDDRRLIVTSWNPSKIKDMALPPCHWSFQFYTNQYPGEKRRRLHIIWNQRSVDTGLGLPFNIASYALLLMIVAQQADMIPGNLIGNLGDTHIYENHIDKLSIQLSRESSGAEPVIKIDKQKDLWNYKPEHFHIENYNPHPSIKMKVSV